MTAPVQRDTCGAVESVNGVNIRVLCFTFTCRLTGKAAGERKCSVCVIIVTFIIGGTCTDYMHVPLRVYPWRSLCTL